MKLKLRKGEKNDRFDAKLVLKVVIFGGGTFEGWNSKNFLRIRLID
jgi:hypothetical protein